MQATVGLLQGGGVHAHRYYWALPYPTLPYPTIPYPGNALRTHPLLQPTVSSLTVVESFFYYWAKAANDEAMRHMRMQRLALTVSGLPQAAWLAAWLPGCMLGCCPIILASSVSERKERTTMVVPASG
jgi:hypothetical protein